MISKDEVLKNLDQVKQYVSEIENKKEEKTIGIAIKNRFTGSIIFQSTKTTYKDAIIEKGNADLRDADLRDADLRDANLRGAELCSAKFYGRGGTNKLKKSQLTDFLNALGFQVED